MEQGMVSLRQDGAKKVLEGITTIEEVFRVTQQ
jgi:general secretion pathway protein E